MIQGAWAAVRCNKLHRWHVQVFAPDKVDVLLGIMNEFSRFVAQAFQKAECPADVRHD